MKTKKVLLGGVAGGVTYFFLGWLVYGVLLIDYTSANFNQCASRQTGEMVWWAMILASLGFGFLLSVVLSWSNRSGIRDGATIGGTLGFLVSASMDLSNYSMSTMYLSLTPLIVDILAYTFLFAVIGIVVAWVMGMGKNK
jgi:hypothetical protein